ncbi:MAG: HisA/HisF-related TIM barrel protein [Desulfobacterales bacterium]|nr:HisA/HisF-related TIM barrel protein [Desulfobacterales bacterium]
MVDLDGSVAGKGMNVQAISVNLLMPWVSRWNSAEASGLWRMPRRTFDLGSQLCDPGHRGGQGPRDRRGYPQRLPGQGRHRDRRPGRQGGGAGLEGTHRVRPLWTLARYYEQFNPAFIVYTDISRDGMLTGPNIEATVALAAEVRTPVVASGGVGSMDDIRALLQAEGLYGAIVGKAIYEGRVDVRRGGTAVSCREVFLKELTSSSRSTQYESNGLKRLMRQHCRMIPK